LVFIFIDEADALLRVRSSGRYLNIANTVVPQFAAEMDGLVSLENVVVMLTSNRPDYIDPAILRPERIDRKVKVGRPNRDASRDIFAIYLDENVPLDPATVREYGSPQAARAALVEQAADYLFRKDRETAFVEVVAQERAARDALLVRSRQRRAHYVYRRARQRHGHQTMH
jgi:proteasome-associated ATPase